VGSGSKNNLLQGQSMQRRALRTSAVGSGEGGRAVTAVNNCNLEKVFYALYIEGYVNKRLLYTLYYLFTIFYMCFTNICKI
jgi:hypothetical protein